MPCDCGNISPCCSEPLKTSRQICHSLKREILCTCKYIVCNLLHKLLFYDPQRGVVRSHQFLEEKKNTGHFIYFFKHKKSSNSSSQLHKMATTAICEHLYFLEQKHVFVKKTPIFTVVLIL
jgi:hypothetical protein